MMIKMDVMKYFEIKKRMVKLDEDGLCNIDCRDCLLGTYNNKANIPCIYFQNIFTEKAVEILEKWDKENSVITNGDKLREIFPNFIEEDFCAMDLGLISSEQCRKYDCEYCEIECATKYLNTEYKGGK